MTPLDFLSIIREESARLADVAEHQALETPVPACPGWSLANLVGHIGTVQRWAAKLVEARAQERLDRKLLSEPPSGAAVVPWFKDATHQLLDVLNATEPDTPVWSWTTVRNAGFWRRRQAHEVSVHRWDAQQAAGNPQPLLVGFGTDGVDELLEQHVARQHDRFKGEPASIHLHCTDAHGEWLVRLGPHGISVEHGHHKGDVAARGTASDLDLFVWGRVPASALEVFGDVALLERFQRLTAM